MWNGFATQIRSQADHRYKYGDHSSRQHVKPLYRGDVIQDLCSFLIKNSARDYRQPIEERVQKFICLNDEK